MTLLEFARGPGLAAAVAILIAGSAWRIAGIYRLPKKPDHSVARRTDLLRGAWRGIIGRMWPYPEYRQFTALRTANGYVYHIGLAVMVFGYWPHIHFFERYLGVSWPALPEPVFYLASGITIVSLAIALFLRLGDPVLRLLSNFDDWFSGFTVMLAIFTGMAAIARHYVPGEPVPPPVNETLTAIHLLAVELMLIWLPFGKLSHAYLVFFSRGMTGAAFTRKGARP